MTAHTQLSEPPYYAVIFSSTRQSADEGYASMAQQMVDLASLQPGFLGVESARGENGFGITVSYWESMQAIARWRANVDHIAAQRLGQTTWYTHYEVRIAKVERAYGKGALRQGGPVTG